MVTLGKYELHEKLGRGGFGTVYRAMDTSLGREVALKVLHPELTIDREFVDRFRQEAKTLALLDDRNIVTIHEINEENGRIYIAMRYLPGGSLRNLIEEKGRIQFTEALKIITQVASGLSEAHKRGVIHRDIKPENIVFDSHHEAILTDFGLVRGESTETPMAVDNIMGTPSYIAPEIWDGEKATAASDEYALGCVFYEMITGKRLFDGKTIPEIMKKHVGDYSIYITYPADVPVGVREVISKAIEKDPQKRYSSVLEFAEALTPQIKKAESSPKKEAEETGVEVRNAHEISVKIANGVMMEFVKVPEGEFWMGSDPKVDKEAQSYDQPQHRVYLNEYWIGKYPVTNKQYQVFVEEANWKRPSGWSSNKVSKEKAEQPVGWVSWYDAEAFCKWLSEKTMKKIGLPTEAQWEKAARGTDGRIYPWGNQAPSTKFANYDGKVGGAIPVGIYPAGASPYGALDMAGNGWEWVADWCNVTYYSQSPTDNPAGPIAGEFRILRGASWISPKNMIRSAFRNWDNPTKDYSDFGFRCSLGYSVSEPLATRDELEAETDPKLSSAPIRTPVRPTVPEKVPVLPKKKWQPWLIGVVMAGVALVTLAVGASNGWFASQETPTAAPIAAETTAPVLGIGSKQVSSVDGMMMVYVPAGDFLMGSSNEEGYSDEHPQHTVYLVAYWIDQTEVTNAMYEKCVNAGACTAPSGTYSATRSSYYGNKAYDDYPVIFVSWDQANAYCQWVGRELPTEAQWEKAARGADGRIYPWGNQAADSSLANYNSNVGDTAEVGSYPAGTSPYGAMDMAGNVWEWVADWYSDAYYSQSPTNNPSGPASGQYRFLRGGSWFYDEYDIRSAVRYWNPPSSADNNLGFRCCLSQ